MSTETGNTITPDLLIVSKHPNSFKGRVPPGSFYLAVEEYLDSIQSEKRHEVDWFIDNETGGRLQVKDIKSLSRRYGALLQKHGMRQNDVLHLLVGPQDVRAFLFLFATWVNGGIVGFGTPNYEAEVISQQLVDSECKFIAVTPLTVPLVKEAVNLLPPDKRPKMFCIGKSSEDDVIDVIKELETITEVNAMEPVKVNVFKDTAVILYTSGTTGRPKGVIHTHFTAYNYFANVLIDHVFSDTFAISNFNTYTQAGILSSIGCLMKGMTLIHNFPSSTLVSKLLEAIRKYHPSAIFLPGDEFLKFADSPLLEHLDPTDAASLKTFVGAAALMPEYIEEKIRRIFPNIDQLQNGYGTSETGLIAVSPTHYKGKLGWVAPEMQIKVVDPDTGMRLGPNKEGEIRVKSPFLMKEYLKRPNETKQYFDEEGFGKMGDIVLYDDNGDIYFVDRLKEILYPGFDHAVSPRQLEAVLQEHEAVKECLIWGKILDSGDDLINACVVLNEGFTESKAMEEELRAFTDERLLEVNRIKGSLTFHPKLPRNNLGKLMRREMKKLMLEDKEATK